MRKKSSKELERLLAAAIRRAADSIAADIVAQFPNDETVPDNEIALAQRKDGSYGLDKVARSG